MKFLSLLALLVVCNAVMANRPIRGVPTLQRLGVAERVGSPLPIFTTSEANLLVGFADGVALSSQLMTQTDAEAEQEARELLELELQLMDITQSDANPTGFAYRSGPPKTWERLWATVRNCVHCVTSKYFERLPNDLIDKEKQIRKEADKGKNIAAAMYINGTSNISLTEIEQMLANGADVNSRILSSGNKKTKTALMMVASYGEREQLAEKIRLLLAAGAELNLQNSKGDTALHLLVRRYNNLQEEALAVLMAYGAEVDIRNKKGETPRMIAQRRFKVVKALVENGQQWRASFFAN